MVNTLFSRAEICDSFDDIFIALDFNLSRWRISASNKLPRIELCSPMQFGSKYLDILNCKLQREWNRRSSQCLSWRCLLDLLRRLNYFPPDTIFMVGLVSY